MELTPEEHVKALVRLGYPADQAQVLVATVRQMTPSQLEQLKVELRRREQPVRNFVDTYMEIVTPFGRVTARSDECWNGYHEDAVYVKVVNNMVVMLCVDGHLGTSCVTKTVEIFKRHCHEMTQISDEKKIRSWFEKRFVEPLRGEESGACVLMGVVDYQSGWFINLGDCRLYVDGKQKTRDFNVSSLSPKQRDALETRLRELRSGYGVGDTHMTRTNDGFLRHHLAVTGALGDRDWDLALTRAPEVVFVNYKNMITMVSDGVTRYLNDSTITSLPNANSIVGEVYTAVCPTPCKYWIHPQDNTSAVVLQRT